MTVSMTVSHPKRTLHRLLLLVLGVLVLLHLRGQQQKAANDAGHRSLAFLYPVRYAQQHQRYRVDEIVASPWSRLATALDNARPPWGFKINPVAHYDDDVAFGYETVKAAQPHHTHGLSISERHFEWAKQSHGAFLAEIRSGNVTVPRPRRGEKGAVVVAEQHDIANVQLAIRFLRRSGAKMLIEVFFPSISDDAVLQFCKGLSSKQRVVCRSMEAETHDMRMPLALNANKPRALSAADAFFKLLAVFFSAMDNVLLLESTTLAVMNPEELFKKEPFLSTGLLLWPDFWAASSSAVLAQVQMADANLTESAALDKLSRMHNGRTVKLSQFFLSKRTHSDALLLALYYTFYGPGMYDAVLLQQGHSGAAGDMALLMASALLRQRTYVVSRLAEAAGYFDASQPGAPFRGTSMVFRSPTDDLQRRRSDWHLPYFIALLDAGPGTPGVFDLRKRLKDADVGFRVWAQYSGRDFPNGLGVEDPEQALWEEVAHIACAQPTVAKDCEALYHHLRSFEKQ